MAAAWEKSKMPTAGLGQKNQVDFWIHFKCNAAETIVRLLSGKKTYGNEVAGGML